MPIEFAIANDFDIENQRKSNDKKKVIIELPGNDTRFDNNSKCKIFTYPAIIDYLNSEEGRKVWVPVENTAQAKVEGEKEKENVGSKNV